MPLAMPNSAEPEQTGPAAHLIALLKERGLTIATAESLTAGKVCAAIATVPGASAVLRGGVVAYATDLKHGLLGVDVAVLHSKGPVDAQVAGQMANGVNSLCGSDVGIATTGVAGPDSQVGKAVGTVFVAVAWSGADPVVDELQLGGNRLQIQAETVDAMLALAIEVVGGIPLIRE